MDPQNENKLYNCIFVPIIRIPTNKFHHGLIHGSSLRELKGIIPWLLPVVFGAVVFKLLVWCGAEGYVSGLQDAAASCKPDNLKHTARNTTGSNHCIILLSS